MKSLAGTIRWYLLAQRLRPIEEADLILDCDSLSVVLKLLWKARTRHFSRGLVPNMIQVLGATWVWLPLFHLLPRADQRTQLFINLVRFAPFLYVSTAD